LQALWVLSFLAAVVLVLTGVLPRKLSAHGTEHVLHRYTTYKSITVAARQAGFGGVGITSAKLAMGRSATCSTSR
jgi:hypothetical protein